MLFEIILSKILFKKQLRYYLPIKTIKFSVLVVSVWHSDRLYPKQFLGSVKIALESIFENNNKDKFNRSSLKSPFIKRSISHAEDTNSSTSSNSANFQYHGESKWYKLDKLQR